jgi:methylenetetrahydrofolate dehydrogenase (NADP+) / methenyltetrahydrofolate cyclohydrolase
VARVIDPAVVAASFRAEIRAEVAALPEPLVLWGVLADEHRPSRTYAEYTRKGCEDVGVRFDLKQVSRLDVEAVIREANADDAVHGVLVYYPVFGTEHDAYLRDCVSENKDIEGLHPFWAQCLYENRRFLDKAKTQKAILPCTPLAIMKLLDEAGAMLRGAERPLEGRRAVVFNRSEIVGRPLASMMANDGAHVISFDVDGPLAFTPSEAEGEGAHHVAETSIDRAQALADADIVVTGVPSADFPLVRGAELKRGAICLNFSTAKNFDSDIDGVAGTFIPRVGPMTVTMALRNTVRLFRNVRG